MAQFVETNTYAIPADFPTRIKTLRERLGLTQAQLAERMGVSFVTVNRWENEKSRPSFLAWQRILRAEQIGIDGLTQDPTLTDPLSLPEKKPSQGQGNEPPLDFSTDPEIVLAVAEGERLGHGYLFNPAFAAETARIDPLPHQRIAVYERMLSQSRLRFLLADDAGAGKTIMAGLYIREMLTRRLIRRILIVSPAGLLGNWERELRLLFNLRFQIIVGADTRARNPFAGPDGNLLIVSIDTLASDRTFGRLQDPAVTPYDLVIVDEAHKLAAAREGDLRVRKTDRYRLAEALAGIPSGDPRWTLPWAAHHLLLLTATPHMGHDFPYYSLWRLLEPEILSTEEAFKAYPPEARQRQFIRRTKEEMVRYDGTPIYPRRITDTMSYDLAQGEISEQTLYDETSNYIRTYYNRARILNRSAARLAMSIFQRRLASSTYALLRSFERRFQKLTDWIEKLRSGELTAEALRARQEELGRRHDPWDERTPDEEEPEDGREQNEVAEDDLFDGVVAATLAELETEREEVKRLRELAHRIYDQGDESKFQRLWQFLRDERYRDEKVLIFTEHRDTLSFLVQRLENLGLTGRVASIHGGMDFKEREVQMEFFKSPVEEGGARYLVATDAAGEGINLQFCWLMVNYDIPWNPARLEQRMGRIHRYGQPHDPVVIVNLVAGKTREGRVLRTLLEKLKTIAAELRSDKVYDVIGRLFHGLSLTEYLEQVVTEDGTRQVEERLNGLLSKEQVEALQAKERLLYGEGGDVARDLSRLEGEIDRETYCRLLPGYVARFLDRAFPLLNIAIEGDLHGTFALRPLRPGALDPFWPLIEQYPAAARNRLTIDKPPLDAKAIFLHPGEPLFERLRSVVLDRFERDALEGGLFIDPGAENPYLFHLAMVTVVRQADPAWAQLHQAEVRECRLVGLRQEANGEIVECPVEHLLLLRGGGDLSGAARGLFARAATLREEARAQIQDHVAVGIAEAQQEQLFADLPGREEFLARGYDYQDAELAARRARLVERATAGEGWAKAELAKVREQQRHLEGRRNETLAVLRREPELVVPGEVRFIAHALVLPSRDPEDQMRHDKAVELMAVRVAWGYEERLGATVTDVSTPAKARAAGLGDHPGFDLLSKRPDGTKLAIEVKGRAGIGDVEVHENEWTKACNLRDRYWLYVVYDCATPHPRLCRVPDPFGSLLVRAKGGVLIDEREILDVAEE